MFREVSPNLTFNFQVDIRNGIAVFFLGDYFWPTVLNHDAANFHGFLCDFGQLVEWSHHPVSFARFHMESNT